MIERYVLGDFQTNTYVLSKGNKAVIIDPSIGFERIMDSIKQKYEIEAVLITHAHIDHIDGIKWLKEYPIYISRLEYVYLTDPGYTLYGWYSEVLPFEPKELDFHLVEDGNIIKLLDGEIEVIHLPGHTLGGVAYKYEDTIFTGDTLFHLSIGRTDFKSGNIHDMYKSILHLLNDYDENIRLFPGHDEVTTISFEKENNPYYKEALLNE